MSDQNQNPKLLESILYLEEDQLPVITVEEVKSTVKEHQNLFDRLKDA